MTERCQTQGPYNGNVLKRVAMEIAEGNPIPEKYYPPRMNCRSADIP
jgi:hypothetical protein